MSDATPSPNPTVQPEKIPKSGFSFTDDGCRTEIRVGVLLVLAGMFLWLWLGPSTSIKLCWTGLPLVVIGVPIQAIQARRDGRPAFHSRPSMPGASAGPDTRPSWASS